MNIHVQHVELVPKFSLRFMEDLRIPNNCRHQDAMTLVIYLGIFDKSMSYRLKNEDPMSLHKAFEIIMNIKNVSKYGIVRRLKPKRKVSYGTRHHTPKIVNDSQNLDQFYAPNNV